MFNIGTWARYFSWAINWFSSANNNPTDALDEEQNPQDDEHPDAQDERSINAQDEVQANQWDGEQPTAHGNLYWKIHVLIILPIAIVMCLFPFFGPFVGIQVAQKDAWFHRCGSSDVEVVLDGRPFHSRNQPLVATFYNRATRHKVYRYQMQEINNTWQFHQEYQNTQNETFNIPVQNLHFNNSTFTAYCDIPKGVTTGVPCMEGSFSNFNTKGHLSININITDSQHGTITKTPLHAIDDNWFPLKLADDAPNYLLCNSTLGTRRPACKDVLYTAVTEKGNCASLKLCLIKAADATLLLGPIGLTLIKQDQYAEVCTKPYSN